MSNAGIIRPGQNRPFRKATMAQVESRVSEVELLIGRACRRSQIHKLIGDKHNVDWRTVDGYIVRARESILSRLLRCRDDHRCEALTFYESVILSSDAKVHEKIMARRRIDELLGLDAPHRLAVRDETIPQTPADATARALDSGMLAALELVYGKDARKAVIEIEARRLPAMPGDLKRRQLKIA